MPVDRPRGDAAVLVELAAGIYGFIQAFPNSYASHALASLVNRAAAGETIGDDERELVFMTLIREAKTHARRAVISARARSGR